MAVRPILLPWARQPNNEFALDRQWRPSFVFVPIGGTFADAVSQLPGLIDSGGANGTPTYTATGRALNFAHLSSRSQYLVLPNFAPGAGDFWVLVHGSFTVHSAVGVVFSNDSGQSAGTRQWRLQSGYNGSGLSSGAFSFLTYGGSGVYTGANSLVVANELATFLGVRRGTTVELWKDGRLVSSNTGTAQDVSGAEAQRVGWGWDTGGGYTAGSICDLAAGGLGTLSPSHAAKLSANPWQLFEPRRIWVPVASAGSAVSLTIQDATHAHAADAQTLTTDSTLAVADAAHAHAADNLVLTSATAIDIQEASHAHAADSLTLTTDSTLAVADAAHAHAADNLTLEALTGTSLVVADAAHAHAADAPVLTLESWLAVADAWHAHLADQLTLDAPSGVTVIGSRAGRPLVDHPQRLARTSAQRRNVQSARRT